MVSAIGYSSESCPFYYSTLPEEEWQSVVMSYSDGYYVAVIPPHSDFTEVWLYVFANDTLNNINDTESSSFIIDMNENYYDTYDDNSSIVELNNPVWDMGNVSFCGFASNWWDGNYAYRKKLNITNNVASVLEKDYSINFTLNTTELVSAGKLLANCSDLRIVWWNGTDNIELDRINETACNADATEIWFKLQENISASGWNGSYYMYYGYSSAASPPTNRSKVYLFWDDFEDGNEDGWTEHNGAWNVVNNEYYQSANDATYLRTSNGDSSWVNYILETKIKIASGGATGGFAGVLFRFQNTTEHYAVILDDRPDDSFYIREWTGSSYNIFIEDTNITVDRDTWYDLKVTVLDEGSDDARIKVYIDGELIGDAPGKIILPKSKIQHGSILELKADGYENKEYMIFRKQNAAYTVVDLLMGGIPLIVDYSTGNVYRPNPRKFEYKLEKQN